MRNKKYSMIQIPSPAYDILKAYCKKHGHSMGRFLEILIQKECLEMLPAKGPILRVNN